MLFVLRITKHLLYRAPLMVARVGATVANVCFFVIKLFADSNWIVQRAIIEKEEVNHSS